MLTISKPLSAGQAQTYHAKEFTSKEQNYWSLVLAWAVFVFCWRSYLPYWRGFRGVALGLISHDHRQLRFLHQRNWRE